VTRAALIAVLLAGCLDDEYTCTTDDQCNLGVAGRCELDHHCTQYDGTCALERRYSDHSGSDTGTCLQEVATPLDPCAPGQPPAPRSDACAMTVCAAESQCCTTGWTEACVQVAQLSCHIRCDTRIAVIAEHGGDSTPTGIELYDLRFDGTTWTAGARMDRRDFLTWLAPAPGASEPRLAGLDPVQPLLLVGETMPASYPVSADRDYDAFATVDFDRSGRDLAMLSSYDKNPAHTLIDLTSGDQHDLTTLLTAPIELWGDNDGDPFPDAVAATGSGPSFHFLRSHLDSNQVRQLDDSVTAGTNSGGNPEVRSFSWVDIDHNGRTDLVEFGSDIQFHMGRQTDPLRDVPALKLDCQPIAQFTNTAGCPIETTVAFAGTTIARSDGVSVLASIDNTTPDGMGKMSARSLNLSLLAVGGSSLALNNTTPITFQMGCTGQGCPPLRAVIARDLDGDGILDIVAIDALLHVYVAMGQANGGYTQLVQKTTLPTQQTTQFGNVRVTVSGALR
jgi:hypothetical protein